MIGLDLKEAPVSTIRFATFWHGGGLSPYELACVLSFRELGHPLSVYSFGPVVGLPDGIPLLDARDIVAPDSMDLFKVNGVPSASHFTDYFRFVMFRKTDEIWVDTDIILLKRFTLGLAGNLMGRETTSSVCTAVLHLDRTDPRLQTMIDRVEALSTKSLVWGDTGPRLLTSVYGVGEGLPEQVFYPVHFDDYYKVFLPQYRAECEALCGDATTLHLWNNLVVKMGLFKEIGPPLGSYLHAVFERSGANRLFGTFYPEAVMKTMIHNAVVKVGGDSGVKRVLKLIAPSIRSSVARRWPNLVR